MPGLAIGTSPAFTAKAAPAAAPETPYIRFSEASGSYITCGSPASLDNLPAANPITIDLYVRLLGTPIATNWPQIAKIDVDDEHGWIIWIGPGAGGPEADCNVADADGNWYHSMIPIPGINEWIHIAGVIDFDNLQVATAVNGAWSAITDMYGDMSDESDAPLTFGAQITVGSGQFADQDLAWIRISTGRRWTPGTPFTPPSRAPKPTVDASTYELWLFNEGAGTTAAAQKSTARNGTLHSCSWQP